MNDSKQIQALPMQEERKPLLKDLNNYLMCRLCGGYLVEATSLVECLHSYCRSCIVQYVEINKNCPICEVSVTNKMKPYLSLKPDKIIQRVVYKTVPGLYKNELERRRKYLLSLSNDEKTTMDEDISNDEYYYSPDEPISISLEYIEENKNTITQIPSIDAVVNNSEARLTNIDEEIVQVTHKRYLQCPAAVKIAHINKLIKMKYNLQSNHEVEILYKNVRLPNYFSLMDTAYLFSWDREKPMRLYYQILERSFIQVPVVISNKILDDLAPSLENSSCVKNSLSSNLNLKSDSGMPNDVKQDSNAMDDSASKNFKRKADSTTKVENGTEIPADLFEFREPSLKIPRIEGNGLAEIKNEKEGGADYNISKSPSPSKTEENAVLPKSVDSSLKTADPFPVSENITDYEQDIEEVDEEDDDGDDEGRLLISQLSEEEIMDSKPDDSGQLIIDISDNEKVQEDTYEDKKVKYKRKNKKSKHHHHRKHRHHERKKNATQATILHSPDADSGIILKLKLSNHTSLETKHHKQSKRKHKKNSDAYFSSFSSSSSVSSLTISSPEPHSISRADEDSSHSQISECSADCTAEANQSKKETPKTDVDSTLNPVSKAAVTPVIEKENDSQKLPVTITDKSPVARNSLNKNEVSHPSQSNRITNEQKLSSNKEKLTQMRSFRPKNVAIVRPKEHDGSSTKNDNNNNDHSTPVLSEIDEEKSEPSITDIQRSASSSALTVSKITAAEMKKEQEKLQMFNGSKEEPPALEITVVPSKKGLVSTPSPKPSENAGVAMKPNKSMPKPMKPIPAAIPLSQYQKMKSSEPYTNTNNNLSKLTEHNLPKSLTITPHMVTNTHRNSKVNGDIPSKKMRSTPDLKTDGIKQSVTISLSENDSALDLSGAPKQQIIHSQNKKILATGAQSIRMNGLPLHFSSHLTSRPKSTGDNVVYPMQKFPELLTSNRANGLQYSPASLSVTSTSSTPPKNMKMTPSFMPTILKSQVPIRSNTIRMNHRNEEEWGRKVNSVPQLNEIRKGPPSKPGPNQNVRNIPNLSTILQRQQPVPNFNATPPDVATQMMHRMMSSVCSLGSLKKTLEKCPPAMPINNTYVDRTNLMITK